MKPMHRILAFALVLVMVFADCGIAALAQGVLTMPAALKIIDEEAFYGSTSIDKVVLPEGVTEIHSKAFANSTLSEINLPNSLTFIADDAFDGPDKVTVTANPGTVAYDWAVRNLYINDKLTIKSVSCNTESANIGDVVTWSVIVNGGTNEYNYQYTVYNGKSIVMTSSYTEDASFSYSPTAEGQYSIRVTVDDGEDSVSKKTDSTVNVSKAALKINSIAISTEEAVIGDLVYWTVKTSGGESGLTFSYILKKDGIQVDAVSNSKNNFYSHVLEEKGVYILSATVKDKANASASYTAEALTVGVKPIQIYAIDLENALPVVEGESLTWNVVAGEGTKPYTYIYTLLIDEEESEAIATSNSTYTFTGTTAGSIYKLKVTCRDANGFENVMTSEGILVNGTEDVRIEAPTLKLNSDIIISKSEADATEIEAKNIALSWEQVENAEKYLITLEIAENDDWQTIWQEMTEKLSTVITKDILGDVSARTLYRISSVSVATRESEPAYFYLAVSPESYAITIDGQPSARWDRTLKSEGERSFVISSPLPWRIASIPEWVSAEIVSNTLYLKMSENTQLFGTRSGEVVIENDKTSATVTVNQQTSTTAPILSYFEDALSTDPEKPTEIPAGAFALSINKQEASNSFLRFYEKDSSGQYTYKDEYLCTNKSYCTVTNPYSSITFSAGKDFCIEISGHYSADQNKYNQYELPEDIPTQRYYFRMINDGHFVTLNGLTELQINEYSSSSTINLHASNAVTISSDAEWLTYTLSEKISTTGRGYSLSAYSADNFTGASRTGHLTVECGNEQAILTYTQPDCSPRIIIPEMLSTNSASPTNWQFPNFTGEAICAAYDWSALENGVYTSISSGGESSIEKRGIELTNLTEGVLYRLTLSNGESLTKVYYIKRTPLNNYVSFNDDSDIIAYNTTSLTNTLNASGKWTLSSDASWCTISVKSGSESRKKITFTTTQNTSVNARTARITAKLTGTSETAVYIIEQAGQPVQDNISVYINNGLVSSGYTIEHLTGQRCNLSKYKVVVYSTDPKYTAISQVDWIQVGSSYTSATSPSIKCSENTTGSSRSGSVLFTSGSAQFELFINQDAKMDDPEIRTPSFSTDYNNPSEYVYDGGDLTVKWYEVENAVRYEVDLGVWGGGNYNTSVENTGHAVYSVTIPQSWLDLESDEIRELTVSAFNQYGHLSSSSVFFTVKISDTAYLDGSKTPEWLDVSDCGASKSFTVFATGSWNAKSNSNWLTINSASGAPGDQLIVTAAENTGAKRTGTVMVSVNGNETILTVEQNAYISQARPDIISPALSDDMGNPTILTSVPSEFTVNWAAIPGMNYYRLVLREIGAGRLDESGRLDEGEDQYKFDIKPSSDLRKGCLYSINIVSNCDRWGTMDRLYYFMIADSSAALNLGWYENGPVELDPNRDYADCKITSSGYWTAKASADWIYLDDEYLEKADTDNPGEIDYQSFYGNSGDYLTITVAANPGDTRTGYITVNCGGISKTITVKQIGTYQRAEFTENYSTDSSNPTEIKQGSLALNWTQGEENSNYWIELYQRREDSTFQYDRVYHKTTENRYLTIPQSYLQQGKYYKVYLTTILNGNDKNDSSNPVQTVYLYVCYDNILTLSATVDWSQNYVGGTVSIQANASGGSGEYLYVYRLLRGGQVVGESNDITGMTKQNWYSFTLDQAGNYQAEVTVYDKNTAKTVTRIYTATEAVVEGQKAEISIDQINWTPDAVGAAITVNVTANKDWECRGSDSWITVTKKSSTQGYVTVAANNTAANRSGRAIFNIGGVAASMEIVQEPVSAAQDSTLKLTPAVWSVSGYIAEQTSVLVSSSGDWTITSAPDWVMPSVTSGKKGDRVSFYAKANSKEEPRQGEVIFACGNVTKAFTVTQSAIDLQPHVDRVVFSETSVPTGKNVEMRVSVRNAAEVELWVDGSLLSENTTTVLGDTATIVRAFSMAGERKVQLRAVQEDGTGAFSDEYTISVTSNGELDAPVISVQEEVILGSSCNVTWGNVENAANYTVYLFAGKEQLWRKDVGKVTYITLTKDDLLNVNSYTVIVMATAEGYSQSQGSTVVSVIGLEADQSPFIEYRIGAIAKQTLKKTSESKLLYACTNSDVEGVTVKIKGKEIPLVKDSAASTDTQYVFKADVYPPAEGLNEYNFIAYLKNGQYYDKSWSRHWMYTAYSSSVTSYINQSKTPVFNVQGWQQDTFNINTELTLLGIMNGREYFKWNGADLFVDHSRLSSSKTVIPLPEIQGPEYVFIPESELEDMYKDWWMDNIFPVYTTYVNEMKPNSLVESSKLQTYYTLSRITENENEGWNRSLESTEENQIRLLILGEITQSDQNKIANAYNNSFMKSVAAFNNSLSQDETEESLKHNVAEEIFTLADTALKSAELVTGSDVLSKAEKNFKSILDSIIKGIWDAYKEEYNDYKTYRRNIIMTKAYIDEYAKALGTASEQYVEYLETAYYNELGLFRDQRLPSKYQSVVAEYINSFRNYASASNYEERRKAAAQDILEGTDLTLQQIDNWYEEIKQTEPDIFDVQFLAESGRKVAENILVTLIKKYISDNNEGQWSDAKKLKEDAAVMVEKVLLSNFGTRNEQGKYVIFDAQGMLQDLCDGLKTVFGEDLTIMGIAGFIADYQVSGGFAKMFTQSEGERTRKARNNKMDSANTVAKKLFDAWDVMKKAWELGKKAANIYDDVKDLLDLNRKYGEYITLGYALIEKCKLRTDTQLLSETVPFSQGVFEGMSIDALEAKRQALVTLMNMDESIMLVYKDMYDICKNNDFKGSFAHYYIKKDKNGNFVQDKTNPYQWQNEEIYAALLADLRSNRSTINNIPVSYRFIETRVMKNTNVN